MEHSQNQYFREQNQHQPRSSQQQHMEHSQSQYFSRTISTLARIKSRTAYDDFVRFYTCITIAMRLLKV